jgi:hypothetical protein
MAPRYFHHEVVLANLDNIAPSTGEFVVAAWKNHPRPILRRVFFGSGQVILAPLNGGHPAIVQEKDILFLCGILESKNDTSGEAMSIDKKRSSLKGRKCREYRCVETELSN